MTESEKRQLALQIMAQEQARLASTSFHDHQNATIADLHHEISTRQQYYNDFAQQGITFRDFQKAYSDRYASVRTERAVAGWREIQAQSHPQMGGH